jgi:2-iminobutanoate/2-iminopropanoate deaminase
MTARLTLIFPVSLFLISIVNLGFAQTENKSAEFENSTAVWSAPGYSQKAIVDLGNSKMIIIAGQIPFDSSGNLIGKDDLGRQTEQVFQNIKKLLAQDGATMSDLVKIGIFLTDMTQLPAFRQVRNKFINLEYPPASTLVQVNKLFREDVLVEVEATAIVPKK